MTLAIAARAQQLAKEGKDVVSLGAGEPDFATPPEVADAGVRAIQQGRYRYTAAAGTPALRDGGRRWFRSAFGLDYGPAEIMATAGAKPALHVALSTVVEPGDRVLILAPYWVSYPALVRMSGGEPVVVAAAPEHDFLHSPAQLAAAIDATDARGIVVNFPNNPSGAVPPRAWVEALVQLAAARGLWLLSDEIYALLTYDDAQHVSPAMVPGGKDRTLVVNGFTKSHTLTGWRIGFLAGPEPVIAAATRIQSQVLGNPCTISQEAALAACDLPPRAETVRRLADFDRRRRYLGAAVGAIPGLQLRLPQGAFYALVDARDWCERLDIDDVALCRRLLDEQLLATVPGSAFGAPGFVRLSYAAAMPELERAVERLQSFAAVLPSR